MDRNELISAFADRMVDQMDMETVCTLALEYLEKEYAKYTDEQLRSEVEEYAPDLLENTNEN